MKVVKLRSVGDKDLIVCLCSGCGIGMKMGEKWEGKMVSCTENDVVDVAQLFA